MWVRSNGGGNLSSLEDGSSYPARDGIFGYVTSVHLKSLKKRGEHLHCVCVKAGWSFGYW